MIRPFGRCGDVSGKASPGQRRMSYQNFQPGITRDSKAKGFSAPGVTTALVGMSSVDHVAENLELVARDPAGSEAFERLFTGSA